MTDDIHAAIRKTESAIAGCVGSRTRLCKLPRTPVRRAFLKALEHAIDELETELARLKYAARHPKAAA